MAANKGFIATEEHQKFCHRCSRMIEVGQNVIYYNKPYPQTLYHVNCESPVASGQEFVEPVSSNGNGSNGHSNGNSIEQAIRELIERTQGPKQEINLEQVAAIARDAATTAVRLELEKLLVPTRVEVVRENGEIKRINSAHKQLPKLLKLARMGRKNTYLYGASQGGKSTAARQVAEALGLPYYSLQLNLQSQPSLITGYKDAKGDYQETDFYRWYTQGGVFCLEEYDNASGNFQTTCNEGFANGHFSFPCGRVERHPDAILFACGNTTGLGASRVYSSRQLMDEASRGRFIYLKWEYDTTLELAVAKSKNPKDGELWTTWVQTVRAFMAQSQLERPIATPQVSIEGAEYLREFPVAEVADMCFFKGCDSDTQAKILNAVPLPKVGA